MQTAHVYTSWDVASVLIIGDSSPGFFANMRQLRMACRHLHVLYVTGEGGYDGQVNGNGRRTRFRRPV